MGEGRERVGYGAWMQVRKLENIAPYMVFLAVFAVYLLTAAPLITAGDSGELVSAAFLLGVPHPPGYPLYCIIGKAFSFLPAGNVAFRLNVMSAFFSALSAALVYRTALLLIGGKPSAPVVAGAAATSVAVAFTGLCWGQAVSAEVYPLQVSLSLMAMFVFLKASHEADFRYVYLGSFLFGLSVVAHYSALLLAPGFVFYLFYKMHGTWDRNRAAASLFFVLLGLSVFVYLAPRAYAGPAINWGDPENFRNFILHISRASYGDLSVSRLGVAFSGLPGKGGSGTALLVALISAAILLLAAFQRYLKQNAFRLIPYVTAGLTLAYLAVLAWRGITPDKAAYLGSLVMSEALPVLLAMAAAGFVFVFVRDRAVFFMLALELLTVLVVSVYRIPSDPKIYILPLVDKFFIPVIVLAGIPAAYAAGSAAGWANGRNGPWKAGTAVLVAMFAALPVFFFARGCEPSDRSRSFYAYDYSASILRGMEQDAVYLAEGDNQPFLMMYQMHVELRRPDIAVFEETGNIWRPYDEARMIQAQGLRPFYCTADADTGAFQGVALERYGLISRFPFARTTVMDPWEYYRVRMGGRDMPDEDYPTREIIADYYYKRGLYSLLDKDRKAEALDDFEAALGSAGDYVWVNYNTANILRDYYENPARALKLYEKATRLAPGFAEGYLELGKTYVTLKDYGRAVKALEQSVKWDPSLAGSYYALAKAAFETGRKDDALGYWKTALRYCSAEDRPAIEKNIAELEKKP